MSIKCRIPRIISLWNFQAYDHKYITYGIFEIIALQIKTSPSTEL